MLVGALSDAADVKKLLVAAQKYPFGIVADLLHIPEVRIAGPEEDAIVEAAADMAAKRLKLKDLPLLILGVLYLMMVARKGVLVMTTLKSRREAAGKEAKK